MSSLLKEAIVDAKALRESALKNAETSIIQKYSGEVKETLESSVDNLADTYKFVKPESEINAVGTRTKISPERSVVKENLDLDLSEGSKSEGLTN